MSLCLHKPKGGHAMNINDFFERATALRGQIVISNDYFKVLKLELLTHIVGEVFKFQRIPENIEIQYIGRASKQIVVNQAQQLLEKLTINSVCKTLKVSIITPINTVKFVITY